MKTLVCFAVVLATASAYNMGRSGGGGQYVYYDSQKHGVNHPAVVYDSKRDGYNAARANQFANDPSLTTVFDSKRDSWNHPYVTSNTRSSGGPSRGYNNGGYMQSGQRQAAAPVQQMRSMQQPRMQMQAQQPRSQQQSFQGRPTTYDNYEVIFDSKRDGWDHPWVVYDSKRGDNPNVRSKYDNDPNLVTIFDSKVDGWNHPYVIYDSRRDGNQRRY